MKAFINNSCQRKQAHPTRFCFILMESLEESSEALYFAKVLLTCMCFHTGETDCPVCFLCRQPRDPPTTIGIRTLKAAFKALSTAQDSEAAFAKLDQKDLVLPNLPSPSSPTHKNKRPRKNENENSALTEGEGGSELQPKNNRMTISRLVLEEDSQNSEPSPGLHSSPEPMSASPSKSSALNQPHTGEKNPKYEDLLCSSFGAGWRSWLGLVLLLWMKLLQLSCSPPRLAQTARMRLEQGVTM